ncbi:hypothetical protein BDZ89DRAFT_400242 [Hymenopellis radicata]|nr:hypothetical protein BDZ89DRAFT_400242 [Hymenopellis radicata]
MGIIRRLHSCVHLRPPYRSFKYVGPATLWRSYLTQPPSSQLFHTRRTPPQIPEASEDLPDDLKDRLFAMPASPKIPKKSAVVGQKYAKEKNLERRNTLKLLNNAVDVSLQHTWASSRISNICQFYTNTPTPNRTRTLRKIYEVLGVRYIDGTGVNEAEEGVVDTSIDSIVGNVYQSSLEILVGDIWTSAHPDTTQLIDIFQLFEKAGWRVSGDDSDYLTFVPEPQDGPDAPPVDRNPRAFKESPLLPFRLNITGRELHEPMLPGRRGFILLYIWLRSYGLEVSTSGLVNFWRSPSLKFDNCSHCVEEFYFALKVLKNYDFDSMLYYRGARKLPYYTMKKIVNQLKAIFALTGPKLDFIRHVEFERISASIFGPNIHPGILDISPDMSRQLVSERRIEDGRFFIHIADKSRGGAVRSGQTNAKRGSEGGPFRREYTTQAVVEGTAELLDPPPPVQVQSLHTTGPLGAYRTRFLPLYLSPSKKLLVFPMH